MSEQVVGKWRVSWAREEEVSVRVLQPKQVHGGRIIFAGQLLDGEVEADGVVVSDVGVVAGVHTADCMPIVLLTDIAAVVLHASRKSLIAGLLDRVPEYLDVQDIEAVWFGPHICVDCFAFDWEGDSVKQFRYLFPAATIDTDSIHLSLEGAVRSYLNQWGLPDGVIMSSESCTYESNDIPSYRRWLRDGNDGDNFPRFLTFVERVG